MVYLHVYFVTKRQWNKVLSHSIRFFQGTEYDHAGFGLASTGDEPLYVNEATLKGVVQTPIKKFMDNHSFVVHHFKIPLTDEERDAIRIVMKEHTGKKYSVMQLVGNLFAIIMKRCFNYIVRRNIFGNKWARLVCSEYLGKVLTLVGGVIPEKLDFESIDIKDCFEMNKNIDKAIRMK